MARDKKLIIGNWKMNMNVHDASLYLHKLVVAVQAHRDVTVVLAPTMLAIQTLSLQINRRQFKLAAQNMYWRDEGPFTGEVSAYQLRGIADYVIIGHSERRHVFGESEKDIRHKVQAAVRNGITPVLCIGETAGMRTAGETSSALHDQLVSGLANVTSDEISGIVIAYEPVWAIGTGVNALPSDVKKAVKTIRNQLGHLFGVEAAEAVCVLYGGSVSPDNAADLLAVDGVDGFLVGGASLDAAKFSLIVEKAHNQQSSHAAVKA